MHMRHLTWVSFSIPPIPFSLKSVASQGYRLIRYLLCYGTSVFDISLMIFEYGLLVLDDHSRSAAYPSLFRDFLTIDEFFEFGAAANKGLEKVFLEKRVDHDNLWMPLPSFLTIEICPRGFVHPFGDVQSFLGRFQVLVWSGSWLDAMVFLT